MNMFKKNGGFTLVELIVVIAILAILAGVAVPAYSGYITKANEASDVTQLDAIKTAATFAFIEKNNTGNVSSIKIVASDSTLTVYVNGTEEANKIDVSTYYTFPGFKSGITSATWSSSAQKWELTKG